MSADPALGREARGELEALALTVADWAAKHPGESFSAFFPLADGYYWGFARGSWMSGGELGVMATTHVIVINESEADKLCRHPLDLCAAVPLPAAGRWRPDRVVIETDLLPPQPAGDRTLPAQAAEALIYTNLHLAAPDQIAAEGVLADIMACWQSGPIGWSTTPDLAGPGFDPAQRFPLVVSRAGNAGLTEEAGPAWRVWAHVFSNRGLTNESHAALSRLAWRREYRDLTPATLVERLLFGELNDLDTETRFSLIACLSMRSGGLPEPVRAAFRGALAVSFQEALSREPAQAARLIGRYLKEVYPHLGQAMPLMPAAETVNRDLVPTLDQATAEQLAGMGLTNEFKIQTTAALPRAPIAVLWGLMQGANKEHNSPEPERRRQIADFMAQALYYALRIGSNRLPSKSVSAWASSILKNGGRDAKLALANSSLIGPHRTDDLRKVRKALMQTLQGDSFRKLASTRSRQVAVLRRAVALAARPAP